MIGEVITCHRIGCGVVFTKKTHNQIYHEPECTRLATNEKIMVKYYQRQSQRLGHARHCDTCEAKLSKYNSDLICNSCKLSKEANRNSKAVSMLASVSWA
jgi:hypothetical protein